MEELLLWTERGWTALLSRPYVRSDHKGAFQAEKSRSTYSGWKKPVPTESVVERVFKPR